VTEEGKSVSSLLMKMLNIVEDIQEIKYMMTVFLKEYSGAGSSFVAVILKLMAKNLLVNLVETGYVKKHYYANTKVAHSKLKKVNFVKSMNATCID